MKRSKTYFCHDELSFRPIYMKPMPKCSLFNSLSFDMPHDMVASLLWFIGLYVCMVSTFLKNYWTELHEIFRDDLSSAKDQLIRFWERSDQVQGHEKVKNYWTELHEMFGDDFS